MFVHLIAGSRRTKNNVKVLQSKVSPVRPISDDDSGLGFDGSMSCDGSQSLSHDIKTQQQKNPVTTTNTLPPFAVVPNVTTCAPAAAQIPLVNCIPKVMLTILF